VHVGNADAANCDPHPQPLPTRGRGAHRVCGAILHQAQHKADAIVLESARFRFLSRVAAANPNGGIAIQSSRTFSTTNRINLIDYISKPC